MNRPLALILDDDPGFLAILNHFLERRGFDCKIYQDTCLFVEATRILNPAILFVDLNLNQNEDGFLVIDVLCKKLPKSVPIIVVSSTSDFKTLTKALDLGATDYLVKPLCRDLLISKLMHYVKSEYIAPAPANLIPHSCVGSELKVGVSMQILRIDESGLSLSSDHFIPKGTVISATGGVFNEIIGVYRNLSLIVVESEIDQASGKFRSYAAFRQGGLRDQEYFHFLDSLRKWLLFQEKDTGGFNQMNTEGEPHGGF